MAYLAKLNAAIDDGSFAPTRAIPYRLDAAAIRKTLAGLGITLPDNWQQITAAGQCLDNKTVQKLDAALDEAGIALTERFRFKSAMMRCGLLVGGRSINYVMQRPLPEQLDPWRAQFAK